MIVVITNGRLAGKKAVVIGELDEHHIVVAGINRIPVKSEDYLPSWEKRRNEKFLTFIKKINMNHVFATRYRADVGLSKLSATEAVADIRAKQATNEKANDMLKSAYSGEKSKWLFTPLKF